MVKPVTRAPFAVMSKEEQKSLLDCVDNAEQGIASQAQLLGDAARPEE